MRRTNALPGRCAPQNSNQSRANFWLQYKHERWDEANPAKTKVPLADESASVVNGLGKIKLEDLGLEVVSMVLALAKPKM